MTVVSTLLEPFTSPSSRTVWFALLFSVVVALSVKQHSPNSRSGLTALFSLRALQSPSGQLDLQLLLSRQLLRVLLPIGELFSAITITRAIISSLNSIAAPAVGFTTPMTNLIYTLVLFLSWDASRFVLHRLIHRWPILWQFHQVHHSATVLTPLTFHRIHPLESLLYSLRGAVVTGVISGVFLWATRGEAVTYTVLGVSAIGLVLNTISGNIRHSHVWWSFGRFEGLFISPAMHQIHHSRCPKHQQTNFGTWLSVWDRLAGSFEPATTPPLVYGLDKQNHDHNLLSAWFSPLKAALKTLSGSWLLLFVCTTAWAQNTENSDEEDVFEIIVTDELGNPTAAGSAHVISEEELESFDYTDIHKVMETVPGVYVRGEDGFGLRPNIGIRGANSDRSAKVTLMEDGVLLSPAPYAAPAAYYFPMASRIVGAEVFKGPAAIRQGPQTVGGAINLISRPVVSEGTAAAAEVFVGNFSTADLHGYVSSSKEQGGFVVEGSHLTSGGFKHLESGEPTGFSRSEAMLKAEFRLQTERAQHLITAKTGVARELSHETYLGLHLDDYAIDPYQRYPADSNARMQWLRTQGVVTHLVKFNDGVQVKTDLYTNFLDRQWFKLNRFAGGPDLHTLLSGEDSNQNATYLGILRGDVDSTTPEQQLMAGVNDRNYRASGAQSQLLWTVANNTSSNRLEAGVRFHKDDVRRHHTENSFNMVGGELRKTQDKEEVLLDSYTTASALALHVHDEASLGVFRLFGGARLEHITTAVLFEDDSKPVSRTIILPGGGALLSLRPWLHTFVGAHEGFSPVAPGQDKTVQPERSWSYELGFRASQAQHHAELIGFYNDYDNLTGQCTLSGGCLADDLDRQFNGGEATIYGLEALYSDEITAPNGWTVPLKSTFTFTKTQFDTGFISGFPQFGVVEPKDELPYVPKFQGAFTTGLRHEKASVLVSGHGRSAMRDAAGSGAYTPADPTALFTLDLAGDVALREKLRLSVRLSNFLGSTAVASNRPFGARPVAPAMISAGLKARY